MKKSFAIIIILSVLFSCFNACSFFNIAEEAAEKSPVYNTDINGELVPSFEDVAASTLDPRLYAADECGRMHYNDLSVQTYTGIDVSVFQGDIDWNAVKADGIDFVMLRAGYRGYGPKGILGEDDNFRRNAVAARAAGLEVGAYFFSQATNDAEAREEANYLLGIIRGCDLTYPVAYDWEIIDYDTARTDNMPPEQITACAAAFCDTIAAAGYEPLIYFNCEVGYFNYDLSALKSYHFWLAEYSDIPAFYYNYKIWQYDIHGSVNGINGDVDMNICLHDFTGNSAVG